MNSEGTIVVSLMSRRGSSHDEGELSDDSRPREGPPHSDSDGSHRSGKDKESEIREKLLNRMSKRKNSETEGDDDDIRFTIQPGDAQKAKDSAKNREKDKGRERENERRLKFEKDRRNERRELDSKQRERDYKGRHDRSARPSTSRHEHDRRRKHEDRRARDRSHDRDDNHKNKDEKRDYKRKGISSSDDEKRSKKSESQGRLFDRVLEPKAYKRSEEVIVVEDVEMSPVEILDEKDTPITAFTLDSPAGPKRYSKFESDPETEEGENDKTPTRSSQNSSAQSEKFSDIEVIDDEDVDEIESKIGVSIKDDEDEEENVENTVEENIKWQDLTEEQKEMLTPDVRTRLQDIYQKELISKLPVFYPGIMGCRNIAEYECVNRVEEGTYGVVYRGKDKRTDEIVALKRLKMEKEKDGFPITALREINMLLKAGNHPNIVNVKEILIGTNMDKIYLAMEFVEHDLKSLIDVMQKRNKRFSTGEQKTLLRQLLSGIEHMHKLWILHRDLKTSNLLISHKGVLKIADFGLAREFGDPLKKFTSIVVTLWYRSPELLLGTKYYSTPVDIWSIGCIMAEFILLKPLFPGRGELEQIKKIFMELGTPKNFQELGTPKEQIWPEVVELAGWKSLKFENYPYNQLRKRFLAGRLLNDTGFKLLMRLLTYDPKHRITATEALQHEWFEEDPLPVPPEDFPTFPAKSEQNKAPPPANKKQQKEPSKIDVMDPETAALYKQLSVKPEHVKPGGFSLKFDPSRF